MEGDGDEIVDNEKQEKEKVSNDKKFHGKLKAILKKIPLIGKLLK